MRKVLFKKWILREIDPTTNQTKEGTNCFEPEFTNQGVFHHWGVNHEGGPEYAVAIVELPDGTVTEVIPQNIKFLPEEDALVLDSMELKQESTIFLRTTKREVLRQAEKYEIIYYMDDKIFDVKRKVMVII